MNPKISVYITSFNQEDYLAQAIDSVISQTLPPFEVLVIDDASTDRSRSIISEYQKKYPAFIRYIFNPKNLGITKCRNIGKRELKGDYITYLDGDDFFDVRKLELEYNALVNSKKDIAFSDFSFVNEDGDKISEWIFKKEDGFDFYKAALLRSFPGNSLFRNELISRKVAQQHHYDDSLSIYEDFDFKLRYLQSYEPVNVSYIGSFYRKHNTGLSKSSSVLHSKSLIYIYEKNLRKTYVKSNSYLLDRELQRILRGKLGRLYFNYGMTKRDIFSKGKFLLKALKYRYL